jgi:hypothetical protein
MRCPLRGTISTRTEGLISDAISKGRGLPALVNMDGEDMVELWGKPQLQASGGASSASRLVRDAISGEGGGWRRLERRYMGLRLLRSSPLLT